MKLQRGSPVMIDGRVILSRESDKAFIGHVKEEFADSIIRAVNAHDALVEVAKVMANWKLTYGWSELCAVERAAEAALELVEDGNE